MEHAKQVAVSLLRRIGLNVESIPESDSEQADLFADDGACHYVIEVKQKFDVMSAEESEVLSRGEVFSKSESISATNRFDGILKKGRDQLNSTVRDNAFAIVWLHFEGRDSDLRWQQAFNTFYGCVPVLRCDDGTGLGWTAPKWCFYFDFSAAYKMRGITALVLTDGNDLQVCLNEFAPDIDQFRGSPLFQLLKNGVLDPVPLAISNTIITLRDSDISRRREDTVLAELSRFYGGRFITIRMQRHIASVSVLPPPKAPKPTDLAGEELY